MKALHHFVDRAEQLWMDVAPRPRLERHIANLRAIAALADGCDETYRSQLSLAQERGENEELSVEDRIQLHFTRAQALRNAGLTDQARDEIEDAHRLVRRALVSPLARFSTYLQQSFCAYTEGRHDDSTDLLTEALIIARKDLHGNKLLEARARWLRAQNNYAIFTYTDPTSSNATKILVESMRDGDAALQTLTEGNLDPQARIVLLRLLGGVANHLELPIQQAWYDRQLALLEAQYPPPLR
jgi:tetratricopeptide (TPR) repeat protein